MNNFIKLYLLSCLSLSFVNAETTKFGLGSCLDQEYPQPIWQAIEKENLDYFVFLGDNVYGDVPSGSLREMADAYKKQKNNFPQWLNDLEVFPIWDDHDYGLNDAGSEYSLKRQSQEIYLNFWEIPLSDDRHNRDGIYFSEEKTIQGKVFKLIFLDTRFFRSKLKGPKGKYIENMDPDATILGESQWSWLESELEDEFDFLLIFSSIQIIAKDHPYEKWSNFPLERERLFNLTANYKNNMLLVSGDRHRGGIYNMDGIFEITSSSMNKPGSSFDETDKYLIDETYFKENFGVIEVDYNSVLVELLDIEGEIINSVKLSY
jgi:alkaline phosphatase D